MTLKVPAEVGLMEYNHATDIKPKMNDSISNSKLPDDIKILLKNNLMF